MQFSLLAIIFGLSELGFSHWLVPERVDLEEEKTFELFAGDEDGADDEGEDEMIQLEDLAQFEGLASDEERYKPLHSHVENYNNRAAEAAKRFAESVKNFLPMIKEGNSFKEEKPFVAGFKHVLDKRETKKLNLSKGNKTGRKKRNLREDEMLNSVKYRKRRQEISDSNVTESTISNESDTLNSNVTETLNSNVTEAPDSNESKTSDTNDSNTSDSSMTKSPNDSSELTTNGRQTTGDLELEHADWTSERIEEYHDEKTSIYDSHDSELEYTAKKDNEGENIFSDSELSTPANQFGEIEENYDYDRFRDEYYQDRIDDSKDGNATSNATETTEPDDSPKESLKKLLETQNPKNCTEEELSKFGAKAFACLAFDYRHTKKNATDVVRFLKRTWTVVKIWVCIYVCIAVPAWCQKGWCCCCCRCNLCFPEDRIYFAKQYREINPPGVLLNQRDKTGKIQTLKYKPTLFEIDAYEELESAIRNL